MKILKLITTILLSSLCFIALPALADTMANPGNGMSGSSMMGTPGTGNTPGLSGVPNSNNPTSPSDVNKSTNGVSVPGGNQGTSDMNMPNKSNDSY